MAKGNIHTVPHGDGWANKVEGNERVSNTAPTQAAAADRGRDMARERKVEHLVHRRDGTIGKRNTYTGHDPRRTKG